MGIDYFLGSQIGVDLDSVSVGEGTTAFGIQSVTSLDPSTVRVVFTEEVLNETSLQPILTLPIFDQYNFIITEVASSVPVHRGQETIRVLRVKKVNNTTFDLITNSQTNTWYTLEVFNIYDIYGNPLDAALDSLTFFGSRHQYEILANEMRVLPLSYTGGDPFEVTDFVPDQSLPILQNQDPAPGETDVPQTDPIRFEIVDYGEGVNPNATTITVDGNNAILGGVAQEGYAVVQTVITSGYRYSITPTEQLYEGSYVTIGVYAEDNAYLPMALSTSYQFSTTASPPFLQNQDPAPGATGINPFKTVYFEVVDPHSNIDVSSVVVRINGITALVNNVAQNGHTFERSTVTGGFGYRFRTPGAKPDGINSVTVRAQNGAEVPYSFEETYFFEVTDELLPSALAPIPHRFNVDQIDIILEQKPKTVWNQYDEHGLVVSLKRLEGETNWEYRRRLLDSMVHVSNSSYRGMVHGITRELGLSLFNPLLVNPKVDSEGRFLASDPYIRFDGAFVYLYSDYKNGKLDWAIDRHEAGGNYEHLQRMVEFINTTEFFEAGIFPGFNPFTRSMTLLNQSNRVRVPGETVPASNKFKLDNEHIVRGTVVFQDRKIFRTEVAQVGQVVRKGQYHVDYHSGIVTVASVPDANFGVRYEYSEYPFRPVASPVIVYDITNDNVRAKMFHQVLLDDGTYTHGIPREIGNDIINELLTIVPMYWGV